MAPFVRIEAVPQFYYTQSAFHRRVAAFLARFTAFLVACWRFPSGDSLLSGARNNHHASLLIFEGVDVVAVSSDMGHSVVGTTLNLYSHMFQEAKARNCDAISNALSFTNDIGTEEESPAEDDTEAETEQQVLAL